MKAIVGSNTIKSFRSLDLSYTFRDTLFIYFLLIGMIAASCYAYVGWKSVALLAFPVGALLTGIAFNWINVQIHEASHGLLLRQRKWNDVYCNMVLGSWGLQDVETYRATHGMHHAHLHTRRDPDLAIYTRHTGSAAAIVRGIGEDLLLVTALRRKRQVADFVAQHDVPYNGAPRYAIVAKVAAQSLVLAVYISICGVSGVVMYAAFYLYGLLGVFPVLVRIRTVVQHHQDELERQASESVAIQFISRTTVAPIAEFILVGARMDYHFEHHLYPTLPYYNLRKLHDLLQKAGLFEEVRASGGPELRTESYLKSYATLAT